MNITAEQLRGIQRESRERIMKERSEKIDAWVHDVKYDCLCAAREGRPYIIICRPDNLPYFGLTTMEKRLNQEGLFLAVNPHCRLQQVLVGWSKEFLKEVWE